jgi:hypothetical protein
MLLPTSPLLIAYFALAIAIVVWNISAAGRIVHNARAPRAFVLLTAFGALLLLPGLLIAVSGASVVYGRAIQPIAWVWPLIAILFALQSIYALARRLVIPLFGVPILVYDAIIACVATGHYLSARGMTPPHVTLVLSAAQASALGVVGGPAALSRAMWLFVPLFSPALPSRSRFKAVVRTLLAAGITLATSLVIIEIPAAIATTRGYARYENATLQERPAGDLDFGLQIFPELRHAPPDVAIRNDLGLADTLDVDAVSIIVTPELIRRRSARDSLTHTLDAIRDDSTMIIITLGYPYDARAQLEHSWQGYIEARLKDVDVLTRSLHPNVFIPAYEPYGVGASVLGTLPPAFWIDYISQAAQIAHYVNPNIKVSVAAASYGSRDSALYAWAERRSTPVDILGFSLMPGFDGATSLDTHLRIAQRWMRQTQHPKPHWIWAAGGYPITHGEQSQLLALRGILAWATMQPAVRGVVVTQAGDYDDQEGLRAPDGRLRPAASEVKRSIAAVKESAKR